MADRIYLGKISYGLYVFHMFSIEAVRLVFIGRCELDSVSTAFAVLIELAALSLTILVSTCSYQFYEKPFLRLKERFALVTSRAA